MRKNYRYTISDSYRHFPLRKRIEKKKYFKVLSDFFYELSLSIIRKKYVFKLPYGLGKIYVRESKYHRNSLSCLLKKYKTKNHSKIQYKDTLATDFRFSSFKWERRNHSALGAIRYYDFIPNRGTVDGTIGTIGLKNWILRCANDPNLKNYYEN